MDSDEVTSNSGCSQAPLGGHGEFNNLFTVLCEYNSLFTARCKNRTLLFPTEIHNFACIIKKENHGPQKCYVMAHTLSAVLWVPTEMIYKPEDNGNFTKVL